MLAVVAQVVTILLVTHQIEVTVLENLEEVAVAVEGSTALWEPLHNLEQTVLAEVVAAEATHQLKMEVPVDLES
jgi:hypothetical protein